MKIKYLVLITLVFVLIYIGLSKGKDYTSKVEQPVVDNKSELYWAIYKSDLYNFSFEYPKGAFIDTSTDSAERYLRIQNIDPNGDFTVDTIPDSEYWIDFIVYQKNFSSTLISCDSLLAENYTESDLGKYKVYKGVAKVDEGSALVTTCFERSDYTLLVHGIDFNYTGNDVMNHLLESIKFAD